MNQLREALSQYWLNIQGSLFPWLKEELGGLTEKLQQLVTTLELVRVEEFLCTTYALPGRPPADRSAIARAFVAKMVYNMPTTRALIDRLKSDPQLRRICGWERNNEIPGEWTFSRAFAEFTETRLTERVHQSLINKSYAGEIVGHISRDSTAIEAREKPIKKHSEEPQQKKPRKRGRPRKGEERTKEPTRLERQVAGMSLAEMLDDLPKACDVGTKKNSKGYKSSWTGYKFHIDAADGGIPISCILTSASSHDSQSAIPLAAMTSGRVTNLYDLMDSAYDASEIHDYSRQLEHVPLIDTNPRRNKALKEELANETKRCKVA
ncbi:MAG: transposase, partial [Gammaproteobacteria bacterium]|nr:transposase [Gammaproteobacteria bacterium]